MASYWWRCGSRHHGRRVAYAEGVCNVARFVNSNDADDAGNSGDSCYANDSGRSVYARADDDHAAS
jgi:hypothetical protein